MTEHDPSPQLPDAGDVTGGPATAADDEVDPLGEGLARVVLVDDRHTNRHGVLHGGIDIANSIGTPILAASDGVVVDVGPTAGYGAWVKVRHSDGTVTLYGHVNTWVVSVGQRVFAGDQIATIGNRGNSTGPHCHFEVLMGGSQRIDPVPWLAQRGLSPGNYVG